MNLRKSKTITLSLTEQFRYNLHKIANLKIDLENHKDKDNYFRRELVKETYKLHIGQIIYAWNNQTSYLNKDIENRRYAKIATIQPKQVFFEKHNDLVVAKPDLGVYFINDDKRGHIEYNIYTYWEVITNNEDTI
jgi:hypothetical protein